MEKEIDFNFDCIEDYESKYEPSILLYNEGEYGEAGELIRCFKTSNLTNISIDYENKIFHAEYIGDGRNGIKNGEIFDIQFYKLVIV